MSVAGPPRGHVDPPAAVLSAARGGPVRAVWRNTEGGLTFELSGEAARFVKWAPAGSALDLEAERLRLGWAAPFTPVPRVLDWGADGDGSWLVTAAIDGRSAADEAWLAHPEVAARAVGAGLRALHDALPVQQCPFDWSVPSRLERAARNGISPDASLGTAPPVDVAVVCHGDACVPNTLLDRTGTWRAHVDLGALGVADRWADIAIATWSTEWNYGPGYEDALLDAYGIAADRERTAYYRRLWDAT